jgi:hypothetical protein
MSEVVCSGQSLARLVCAGDDDIRGCRFLLGGVVEKLTPFYILDPLFLGENFAPLGAGGGGTLVLRGIASEVGSSTVFSALQKVLISWWRRLSDPGEGGGLIRQPHFFFSC